MFTVQSFLTSYASPTLEVINFGIDCPRAVYLHVPAQSINAAFEWLSSLGYEPYKCEGTKLMIEPSDEDLKALSAALATKGYPTVTYDDDEDYSYYDDGTVDMSTWDDA